MSQTKELINVLKKALKLRGLTYRDVANALDISEASVKRNFSLGNFTIPRLERVCALVKMDFVDLIRMSDDQREKISSLTLAQEEELVADLKFLLVAICAQNAWQLDEIVHCYDITEPEGIRYLIRLDRHGLIHLLPNNRIRRTLAHDFRWIPQGPIEAFFERTVQNEFMGSHFNKPGEARIYLIGMLSRNSIDIMRGKMAMLAREFASLQQDDARLPAQSRHNTGMIMAIRPWELSVFADFKRRQ